MQQLDQNNVDAAQAEQVSKSDASAATGKVPPQLSAHKAQHCLLDHLTIHLTKELVTSFVTF